MNAELSCLINLSCFPSSRIHDVCSIYNCSAISISLNWPPNTSRFFVFRLTIPDFSITRLIRLLKAGSKLCAQPFNLLEFLFFFSWLVSNRVFFELID